MSKDLPKYEYLNESAFENIVIDIIMKTDRVDEDEAIRRMKLLKTKIRPCDTVIDENTSSIRHGLWNKLIEYDYVAF